MKRVRSKNRIKLLILLCFPFGILPALFFILDRQKVIGALLTAAVCAVLFYPAFASHPETVIRAQNWRYEAPEQTTTSTVTAATVTTTTVTETPKTSKTTKPKTRKTTKRTTKKTTAPKTTTTTVKKDIIYLYDDSEVYTNLSNTYMHTDYTCKNLRGTIVIMTFEQSCRLAIPYCPVCADTIIYVPPEESEEVADM
ncbi:MAG: hypothetical protein IJL87_01555 [Clostridia bacterium]|nr:hypothetical protein [Clostridia bacterium]